MRKLLRVAKGILLFLASITWCALQTLVGAILTLGLLPMSRVQKYCGMIVVYHPFERTFSLGTFAFVSNGVAEPRKIRSVMYGYYLLSLIYGPSYFFAVSLPQLFVRIPCLKKYRAERGVDVTDFYVDRQAARLRKHFGE